jgi:hypothetical protein
VCVLSFVGCGSDDPSPERRSVDVERFEQQRRDGFVHDVVFVG